MFCVYIFSGEVKRKKREKKKYWKMEYFWNINYLLSHFFAPLFGISHVVLAFHFYDIKLENGLLGYLNIFFVYHTKENR